MKPASQARNDIFGGLVSAAVAIPLAMGYGMFALSALGEYYFADGALAGLATAFVVAIVCVALGDRTTTVYAPRINSTFFLGILIYGLVHSDSEAIAAGGTPFILAIAFAVMMLGGVLEALFGLVKLGTLIKFAPQPVMAGFQNAAAALLFLVQIGNVCGFDHNVPFTQVPEHLAAIKPLSLVIAAITVATMWNAQKTAAESSADHRRHRARLGALFLVQARRPRRLSRPRHRQYIAPDHGLHRVRLLQRYRARRRFLGVHADDSRGRAGARHHRFV